MSPRLSTERRWVVKPGALFVMVSFFGRGGRYIYIYSICPVEPPVAVRSGVTLAVVCAVADVSYAACNFACICGCR